MDRKGQAAMEFLMTYGWAILVVIAAIAALVGFGVLDPGGLLPEKCSFPIDLACTEKASITPGVADTAKVQVVLKNSLGFTIHTDNDGATFASSSGDCGADDVDSVLVTTEDGATTSYGDDDYTIIPNRANAVIVFNCGTAVSEGRFSDDITLQYISNESGATHNIVGEVRGRA